MQMVSALVAAGAATMILVDGENVPPSLAGQIITKALVYGRPIVQRVYGDVARLPAWEAAAGFEMVHTGHAKNGADMRICIDALDFAARGAVGRVVIASSDRDFTHLAQYLRARGIEVVGMGEGKTHESFRKACSHFVVLGAAKPASQPEPKKAPREMDLTHQHIVALIKSEGKAGMLITSLSAQMRNKHGFLIGQQEKKTWRGYLAAFPAVYDLDPKGQSARVRLK